jgi:hypothetical protein
LRKEHPGAGPCDRNPEEVREIPEIRHGELTMKKRSDMLQKLRRRGSEDDVINVEEKVGNTITVVHHKE